MSSIRKDLIKIILNKATSCTDLNIHNDIDKQIEFIKQMINNDKYLNKKEKMRAINILTTDLDYYKVLYNEGISRICEICQEKCFAISYCEYCIRNFLKKEFSKWSSKNIDIDNLIQNCQIGTLSPKKIIEWIPYNKLKDIKYLTKGGFSEIYEADWVDGCYKKWDHKERKLIRSGKIKVILKKLQNVESANRSWFEEAESHSTISNKRPVIVQCYGLTQDQDNNYFLVMIKMDTDLRNYLQQDHKSLTWKERIVIASNIINSLFIIHNENAIHRDLHSGNILYSKKIDYWYIGDFGFCGPANKPLKTIYGNLPYIAPEVIVGKEYTFASDVYSIAILMWEISSGHPPFYKYEHNYYLAMKIVNGIRPKIVPGTPIEYKKLIKQCWDADPSRRPELKTLLEQIREIKKSQYDIISNEFVIDNIIDITKEDLKCQSFIQLYQLISQPIDERVYDNKSSSKLFHFEGLPEPKNATEEEQERMYIFMYYFQYNS
ncbi:kinase-like domain-containing protein [Glomus cerebriforme]|uniref:Kinase-like domain-containing protein n=1 Tax=Glomus cerebriforme TaxID=658196 RepID=A0A397SQR1_9GLOM|nr:kinase-like domain-containing protein [Glomus cerebriforme]